tara:strand:- start:140 stop:568 length:429 start_codon:yes stop_codon:yes gene_type:complete
MRYLIIYSFFLLIIYGCNTVQVAREAGKAIKSIDNTFQNKKDDEISKKNESKKRTKQQKELVNYNFINKNQEDLFSTLGQPSLVRKSGNTISIRFDQNECFAYAYINKNDRQKKIKYFEIRNKNGEIISNKTDIKSCLKSFA